MTYDYRDRLIQILDEIQAIGRNGLSFCENPYDRERYSRLLEIAVTELAQISRKGKSEITDKFASEIGYITPKLGVDAAIFDYQDRLLLHRRSDDGRWSLPCGWVEIGESPVEGIAREVSEETGLEVVPTHMLGIYNLLADHLHPHHTVSLFYLCRQIGGEIAISHESTDIGFFDIDKVDHWHHAHDIKARDALGFRINPKKFSAIKIYE